MSDLNYQTPKAQAALAKLYKKYNTNMATSGFGGLYTAFSQAFTTGYTGLNGTMEIPIGEVHEMENYTFYLNQYKLLGIPIPQSVLDYHQSFRAMKHLKG